MKKLMLTAIVLLVVGCSSAPPADVKGKWVGWCEPAMDTKTGLALDISQEGPDIKGSFEATQVSNLGGEEKSQGTFTGKVSGPDLTIKFSKCDFNDVDAEVDVPLKLSTEDGKQVLAGIIMHEGGVGTKYRFELRK